MSSGLGNPEDLLIYYEGTTELQPPRPFTPEKLLYQHAGDGVFLLTLNDAKRLNCMSKDLARHLLIAVEHARRDDRCKVLVWTGAGRAFCSGGNFSDNRSSVSDEVYAGYVHFGVALPEPDISAAAITRAMVKFPKISISAVNGLAIGGGVNIAWCWQDFCFAAEEATFNTPFATLGLTPELGSSFILPQLIGLSKAKEVLQLGKKVSAEEARALGLVVEVVPAAKVVERALAEAKKLAACPQVALRENKRLVNGVLAESIDKVTEDEYKTIRKAFASEETQRAMAELMKKSAAKSKL